MDASVLRRMMIHNIEIAAKAQALWDLTPKQVTKIHKILFGSADVVVIRKILEKNEEDKK